MLQHPVITNMEQTGCPDGKEPKEPHCPLCGKRCEVIYEDLERYYVGCDVCTKSIKQNHSQKCPVCNNFCKIVYQDASKVYRGCDNCVKTRDAYLIPGCFVELED